MDFNILKISKNNELKLEHLEMAFLKGYNLGKHDVSNGVYLDSQVVLDFFIKELMEQ